MWEEGRLRMHLKLFPVYADNANSYTFNESEVIRIRDLFREWTIHENDLFGPYELLEFILLDPYNDGKSQKLVSLWSSGLSTTET